MIFPARRKPLALLFCYGFAGVLTGIFSAEALAQASVPLRVDPVLLGLPPIEPAAATGAPLPVPEEKTSAEVEPVDEAVVEKAVEKPLEPVVETPAETRVDENELELRRRAKARTPAPETQPPVTTAPAGTQAQPLTPTPSSVVLPVPPVPETTRREVPGSSNTIIPERRVAQEPATPVAIPTTTAAPTQPTKSIAHVPAPAATPSVIRPEKSSSVAASAGSGATSSLAPLRVDPALLGPPPAATVAVPAPSTNSVVSGRRAPSGPAGSGSADFGEATPLANQRVPYGPAIDVDSRLADASQTIPPQVPATGARDEDKVTDPSPALALGSSGTLQSLTADSSESRPTFLSAQRMGGIIDREFIAEGDAELRKTGTALDADRMTYWPLDDEVEADGRVRLEQGNDVLSGPKMRLKLEEQVGFFEQPSYVIKRQPTKEADNGLAERFAAQQSESSWLSSGFAVPRVLDAKRGRATTEGHGDADRIDFEGKNQFRLTNSTYTTCKPGNDDWYAKTSELKLDYDREVGEGTDATIYFKDIPILYSPWLTFSLNRQRKSGLLAPSFGTSSDNGIEFSLPYYWNIAPNMDATITPRVMSKRGVMVDNEFRYLNTAYGGVYRDQARVEFLPNDQLNDGENRYGFSLLHTQTTANGFSGQINYNKVSDDDYYTDLSSSIASTSTTQLLQQGVLSYSGGGWWNATANFQQYQTLQPDPENPVREPYKMLPQITVNARKPDFYMTDSSFMGQYTNFTRSDQVINGNTIEGDSGRRSVLYPQVTFPYVTPGWYVTPKLGLNVRHYSLSGQAAGASSSISSTLPIFSVDSGMAFERQSNWFGRDYTQTLEPRLYYLNIPYKDQSEIPRFDTELADFNFAQIFSENQFSGWDRINNSNQLTMAMTSRLLEPSTGDEIMRAMLGQRVYFSPNKVGLDSTIDTTDTTDKWDRSDVLAAFSGQILPKVYADAAWQYNLTDRQVKRYSMGARYQPEPGKVLNASYRYYRDTSAPINQIDLSGQWPISGRWHAVGRLNYSFKDDATNLNNTRQGGRMIESIAGLEYNAGCWVVRGVVQRTALTEDRSSTAFFIQLELTDFGQIGSNPLKLLKRNIQGYSQINQSESETGFDE